MANRPAPTKFTVRPPLALDADIDALCMDALGWVICAGATAMGCGLTIPEGIARLNRVYTGYQPEAARRALRHRRHCDGLAVAA